MKKALAMKWAKALESGKYKQGVGVLNYNDTYCCLGVLCEIEGIKHINGDYRSPGDVSTVYYVGNSLKDRYGKLPRSCAFVNLASANDGDSTGSQSFKAIAKLIRRYWRYL